MGIQVTVVCYGPRYFSIKMKSWVGLAVFLQAVLLVAAQESINPREGINTGMHVGIALAMSFTILITCQISVNCIKKRCVKVIP